MEEDANNRDWDEEHGAEVALISHTPLLFRVLSCLQRGASL